MNQDNNCDIISALQKGTISYSDYVSYVLENKQITPFLVPEMRGFYIKITEKCPICHLFCNKTYFVDVWNTLVVYTCEKCHTEYTFNSHTLEAKILRDAFRKWICKK